MDRSIFLFKNFFTTKNSDIFSSAKGYHHEQSYLEARYPVGPVPAVMVSCGTMEKPQHHHRRLDGYCQF